MLLEMASGEQVTTKRIFDVSLLGTEESVDWTGSSSLPHSYQGWTNPPCHLPSPPASRAANLCNTCFIIGLLAHFLVHILDEICSDHFEAAVDMLLMAIRELQPHRNPTLSIEFLTD